MQKCNALALQSLGRMEVTITYVCMNIHMCVESPMWRGPEKPREAHREVKRGPEKPEEAQRG